MSRPPAVRPARVEDLAAIVELEAASFADPWAPALVFGELVQPGALLLVAPALSVAAAPLAAAASASGLAGYASFRQAAGEAELLRVAVHPAWRRRGIARALILRGLERLRDGGVGRCYLEVRTGNAAAISLYRDLGFDLAGRRTAYYRDGSDALVYRRELGSDATPAAAAPPP